MASRLPPSIKITWLVLAALACAATLGWSVSSAEAGSRRGQTTFLIRGIAPVGPAAGASSGPPRASQVQIPQRTGTPEGCPEGIGSGGHTPNQYGRAYGISRLRSAGLSGGGTRIAPPGCRLGQPRCLRDRARGPGRGRDRPRSPVRRLGRRGHQQVAASGDYGSSGCAAPGTPPAARLRAPSYPATSPWVTAVGGTAIELDAGNRLVGEAVWNDQPLGLNSAGGGASLDFGRPLWQRAPGVSGRRRISPDVSFLADPVPGYAIYCSATNGGPTATPPADWARSTCAPS